MATQTDELVGMTMVPGMTQLPGTTGQIAPVSAPAVTPTPIANVTPVAAPAPTPVSTPAPQPVGAQTSVGFETPEQTMTRIQSALAGGEQTIGDSISDFATQGFGEIEPEVVVDADQERRDAIRNQTRLHQAEIDATNEIYNQQLNEARIQGQGRLGSQRAGAARGGLLGSDFAGSQKAEVQGFNTDIQRGIQAERAAAIGAIMGTVRSGVASELAEKRAARQEGAEAHLDYLNRTSERRDKFLNQVVSDMLTQGYDYNDLTEEEIAEVIKGSGLKPVDVKAAYAQAKAQQESAGAEADLKNRKTESEITKNLAQAESEGFVTLGEGTMLFNPSTGEQIKNPKTFKPDAPSGISIGSGVLNQQAIADVHDALNDTRGEDGYADTSEYMAQFNAFVSLGGDPKDFIKEYEPDIYIDPEDENRSFLKSQMQKQSNASSNVFLGTIPGLDIKGTIQEVINENPPTS